ncbi:cytosolic carboxypeptidase 2-like [Scyliorhinus canicula]|uniref:cytosolic carboxypeptidase 2-like n=1 Tax=Scyliorhinus canicula TaxID=7830 RepID=UPI0018F4A2A4|nr:cytosolic carboxypeptidase 2-like [Scyliorhinus canicula]
MKLQSWQLEGELESNQNEAKSEHNSNSSTEGDGEARKCTYSFINEHQLLRTRQVVFAYHAGKHIPRLREPHNLYAVASCGPQQAPRWPIECDVIKEHGRHIEWAPPVPEKLYQPTGQEYMPNCVGENGKNTVFCIAGDPGLEKTQVVWQIPCWTSKPNTASWQISEWLPFGVWIKYQPSKWKKF